MNKVTTWKPGRTAAWMLLVLILAAGVAWWTRETNPVARPSTRAEPSIARSQEKAGEVPAGEVAANDMPRGSMPVSSFPGRSDAKAEHDAPDQPASVVVSSLLAQNTVPNAVPATPLSAQARPSVPARPPGSIPATTPAASAAPARPPQPGRPAVIPGATPFVPPTEAQMRNQPAATTSAQILSVKRNLADPAERAAVVKALSDAAQIRKEAAEEKAKQMGIPIRGSTPGGGSFELQDFDEKGQPVYHATNNVNAAISTNAHVVRSTLPYDVDGTGLWVGIWDSGRVRETHGEFLRPSGSTRVLHGADVASNATYDAHATHVAGTIGAAGNMTALDSGGNPVSVQGMAPGCRLFCRSSSYDFAEMTDAAAVTAGETNQLKLSNHSYSQLVGWRYDSQNSIYVWYGLRNGTYVEDDFGRYSDYAATYDGIVYNAPYYLPFQSAGNDRNNGPPGIDVPWMMAGDPFPPTTVRLYDPATDPPGDGTYKSGYDTLSHSTLGKNTLMVGAVTDAIQAGSRDVASAAIADFSSWGPADDGRIKPDIVANGVALLSTGIASDTATATLSGSSMATPNACGSAALLQQLFIARTGVPMRASTLKGLIIHTADDIDSDGDPFTTPDGPDYRHGWGLMNTKAAADVILHHTGHDGDGTIIEGELTATAPAKIYKFHWDGTKPLRVTLCWTDPPGAVDTDHDNHNPDLVNDLDVSVVGPSPDFSELLQPYVMPYASTFDPADHDALAVTGTNTTDNVEQVHAGTLTSPGLYYVSITGQLSPSHPSQHFSLIVTGESPHPDIAVLAEGAPIANGGNVSYGAANLNTPVVRTFRISNTSQVPLEDIGATVIGSGASAFALAPLPPTTLAPGASADFTVSFQSATIGSFSAILQIESSSAVDPSYEIALNASAMVLTSPGNWITPAGYTHSLSHVLMDANSDVVAAGMTQDMHSTFRRILTKVSSANGTVVWQNSNDTVNPGQQNYENFKNVQLDRDGNMLVQWSEVAPHEPYYSYYKVAKFVAANGAKLWQQATDPVSGHATVEQGHIAVDFNGNLIVASTLATNPNVSSHSARVSKFWAATGALLWECECGLPGLFTSASHLAVNESGHVAVASSSWASDTSSTLGMVVARLAPDGSVIWRQEIVDDAVNGEPLGLGIDEEGNVFASGVKDTPFPGYRFLAKYSSANGALLWEIPIYASDLMVDARGDVICASSTNYHTQAQTPAKYSGENGALIWSYPAAPGSIKLVPIKLDAVGNVVASESINCRKLSGRSGAQLWERAWDSPSGVSPRHTTDATENLAYANSSGHLYNIRIPDSSPSITSVGGIINAEEGAAIVNSGTFSDNYHRSGVLITASQGNITTNDTTGEWNWSLPSSDGPDDSGTVTVTARDGKSSVSTTFNLVVSNVPPAFEAGTNVTLTLAEAASFSRVLGFTDPGADAWAGTVSYGDGSPTEPLVINQTSKTFTLGHVFASAGSYTVVVTLSDGDPDGTTTDNFLVLVGGGTTMTQWAQSRFSEAEITGGLAAPTADPDNDNIKNLIEYALDLDPRLSSTGQLPQAVLTGGNLVITFTQPAHVTGVTYGAEWSTSMADGTWSPITDTGSGGTHTFSVPIESNTKIFSRLKVMTAP